MAAAAYSQTAVTGVSANANAGRASFPYATAQVHDEDLLLFETYLDNLKITDGLSAYGTPEDPLLPLGELARLLDLNLTVSPAEGRVIGVLGESQRSLTIDLGMGVAMLNGMRVRLAPEDVAVTGVDIYVRASALQRLLPIDVEVDVSDLEIRIKAMEKLPVQARMERMAQLNALHPEQQFVEEGLRIASPYTLFSPPAFDVILQTGSSVTGPKFSHSYDVRLAGDLLYTDFQGYAGSDQNGALSSVRAVMERHDAGGNLLGPLHATSAAAGDVFTPALSLGPSASGGRGISLSTAPLEQTSVFNRVTLRGELPVGYDVQLFINDVLRSGQRTPVQGRYEFLNVPLVRGLNVIRIVENGPTGQRVEQTRIINVGGGQLPAGSVTFEMGVVQQDTPLIPINASTGAADTLGKNLSSGPLRATADLAYGLTEEITLTGGAAVFTPPGSFQRTMLTSGLRTSLFGAAVVLDAARDTTGGQALSLGLAGQPFGFSAAGRIVAYDGGFLDETAASGSAAKPAAIHAEANMDMNLQPFDELLLPVSLMGSYDVLADHSTAATAGFHASSTVSDVLLSTSVDLTTSHTAAIAGAPASSSFSAVGNLSASTFYDLEWQLRSSLDFALAPHPNLRGLAFTVDHSFDDLMALRLGYGRSFVDGSNSVQAGAIMHTGRGDLTLSGNYVTPSGAWTVGLTLAFGVGYDPAEGSYHLGRPGPAAGGNISFQSFIDSNGDGVYDGNDKPVPLVELDGGESKAVTNEEGRAFVSGLGSGPTGRLNVGLDSIEDPYVQAPSKTILFEPRPGVTVSVPYALSASSEIIIHVMVRQGQRMVGLSAVRVRLARRAGSAIETSTEYDGSASFDDLKPGTYDFLLEAEQAERLHMQLAAPLVLTVPSVGGPLPDLTAEVVFDRPAPAADNKN